MNLFNEYLLNVSKKEFTLPDRLKGKFYNVKNNFKE